MHLVNCMLKFNQSRMEATFLRKNKNYYKKTKLFLFSVFQKYIHQYLKLCYRSSKLGMQLYKEKPHHVRDMC